jgi:hypothetical protein
MLDLGLGSLQAFSLQELVRVLFAMATWIAMVVFIGFDAIVIAIVVAYAIPILVELGRRAWCRVKSRLCAPD